MRKNYTLSAILTISMIAILQISFAQTNIFPSTGRAGIYTTTPKASLQIKGGAKIGGNTNYLNIDSATGNLSFSGSSQYLVGGNKYAFAFSGNPNYGLFFNATSAQYEFRDSSAVPVFLVKANTGDGIFKGNILPKTDNLVSLGDPLHRWKNGYFSNSIYLQDSTTSFIKGDNQNVNIWIGYYTGKSGNGNIAVGNNALYYNTGSTNIAIGANSLAENTTGNYNIAIGVASLRTNTTGYENVANGVNALENNTTGHYNTAVGTFALNINSTGGNNTACGYRSMNFNSTGSNNTAYGYESLQSNSTGSGNTAIGYNSLSTYNNNTMNTTVGYFSDVSDFLASNSMALGANATSNASNKVVVGNNAVSVIGGQVGWSTFSDGRFKSKIKENVPGLAFINRLKPVTYHIEARKFEKFLGKKDNLINDLKDAYESAEKKVRTGFIAQDVEKAAKGINYDFEGVNHPQNDRDNYSLVYADFVPSLVKAVQELSAKNDAKDVEINDLKTRIAKLEAMMNVQQSAVSKR